jgi:hypothetical protein
VTSSRRHDEDGMAIVMVVFLVVVVSTVVGVLAMHLASQSRSSIRQGARTASMDVAGAGVQAMQQALVAGRNADAVGASQADGFSIDASSLKLAAERSGGKLVANTSLPYRDVDTSLGGMTSTIEGPEQGGTRQYWQVVQALAPTGTSPWLTLYVRGWRTIDGRATEASVVRARLKPGSMADYQLLSDVPISLDAGATINGRVHSNGGTDEWSQPPVEDPGQRVWATGTVKCASSTGIPPVVSTARGTIGLAAGSGCDVRPGNGEYVPLDSARDAVMRIRARKAAAAADVSVFSSTDASSTAASVEIRSDRVVVTYPGKATSTIGTAAGKPLTLLFDRDVQVRSTAASNARLTIAAWTDRVVRAAPSVIVTGDVLRGTPSTAANGARAIGLLAEGDIVLDPSSSTYPKQIQAALLSATGGVRLPWRYRTPVRVTSPANFYPAQRASLSIIGSIASHSSIATRWSWGSDWIGWSARTYAWDPWLATYPPPYWPASNPWEIVDQSEANADCYGARAVASMRGGAACR